MIDTEKIPLTEADTAAYDSTAQILKAAMAYVNPSEVITSATLLILPQKSLFVNNFFKVFLFFSNFFQSFLFPVGTAPFSDRSPSSIIAFIIC